MTKGLTSEGIGEYKGYFIHLRNKAYHIWDNSKPIGYKVLKTKAKTIDECKLIIDNMPKTKTPTKKLLPVKIKNATIMLRLTPEQTELLGPLMDKTHEKVTSKAFIKAAEMIVKNDYQAEIKDLKFKYLQLCSDYNSFMNDVSNFNKTGRRISKHVIKHLPETTRIIDEDKFNYSYAGGYRNEDIPNKVGECVDCGCDIEEDSNYYVIDDDSMQCEDCRDE